MLNLENYIFKGTSNNHDSSLLVTLLNLIGIDRNGWALNSCHKLYWINNNQIEATNEGGPVPARQYFIDVKGLIELILSEHPELEEKVWWKNLKVGDQVVINFPRNKSYEDYPFGRPIMYDLDGKTVTIGRIIDRALSYSSMLAKKEDFNGDYNAYLIEECRGYNFHSSMFLAPDTKPVKKLQLSSVGDSVLKSIEEIEQDSIFDDAAFLKEFTKSRPVEKADFVRFVDPVRFDPDLFL